MRTDKHITERKFSSGKAKFYFQICIKCLTARSETNCSDVWYITPERVKNPLLVLTL